MSRYTGLSAIFKREFKAYFATPLGYIFLVIFLMASGWLTVARDFGQFLELRQASLVSFFSYLPHIFVVLVPAVAMRLWAEERKTGTVELLFTLPVTLQGSYLGKFLAGWAFLGVALALTFPVVIWVSVLGSPDWGTIVTGYFGSFLLAGAFLSIGMLFSALTKNQVVSFILSVAASVFLLSLGLPQVLEAIGSIAGVGGYLEQLFSALSLIDHFQSLMRGLLELRTVAFFVVLIGGWLGCGMMLLNQLKAS
ncbi:ABC transporter permease subunit [Sulfidibacter corallicola]|uniref:ABC transporter permease subunit n=1 Tax=Sulfidibacter corallicola TaxID=2818388 RepID=A0A8A4TVX9_SULCO|nr:ABC transporter permease [Sulfidibacter corallicola]QTD53328.1 ABC transporter permease subunit [Sulfidibacter corallicola]